MKSEFQTRFTVVLLVLLTAAAVVFAGLNFSKEHAFQIPYDGVVWDEGNGRLVANRVVGKGPGERAGIKVGDQLVAVERQDTQGMPALMRQIYRRGVWAKATYSLLRGGIPLDTVVVLEPADRSANDWLRFIALIYLGIGMYILLRRWTAPGSLHFYIFCLVSFVYYAFKYTGKLNEFDWIVLGSNVVAGLLQPALFLHFALVFPEKRPWVREHRGWLWLVYLPGTLLLAIQVVALSTLTARANLVFNLDRLSMAYLAAYFLCAAFIMRRTYKQGSVTANVWLCHFPLPPDGRRPHLQARRGLHAGSGVDCGSLLRGGCRGSAVDSGANTQQRPRRTHPGHGSYRAAL